MKKSPIILISILLAISSCNTGTETNSSATIIDAPPSWTENAVLYEMNVRQFTKKGTFNAAAEHLPRLKNLGIDIIWLMPIYPIGEVNRKGSLGSPYAVKNYTEINPELGNAKDLKNFIDKAHNLGMKVILDWVANHTSPDNIYLSQYPDWYEYDIYGDLVIPEDWTDVVELNYDNAELRQHMINDMKYWVTNFDIDGFRCDMAGMVPTSFWEEATAALDSVKPLFMLAEDEQDSTLTYKAFDANYGWVMHHLMNDIAKGKRDAKDLANYIGTNMHNFEKRAYKMLFTSNHDENAWNGSEIERLGDGVEAFAVLTYSLPGIPMMYNGQEIGLARRLKFFEKDSIQWIDNPKYSTFYRKLNAIKHSNPALANGNNGGKVKTFITNHPNKVLAFERTKGENCVITIANLNDKTIELDINLKGNYKNLFTDKIITINKRLSMEPWGYYLLSPITDNK